jgi:hypothetical protein
VGELLERLPAHAARALGDLLDLHTLDARVREY